MKYLITGITGFVGSYLKDILKGEIFGLVHTSEHIMGFKHKGYTPLYGDLGDYFTISKIVKDIKPDIVIHLGALTGVSMSFERPHEYVQTNVIGTQNLAESNRLFNPYLKKFIFAGTPEEYGIQTDFPTKETAPLNPNSPYAVSKVAATLYLRYMHRAYDFPVVISRHANCYGRPSGEFSRLGVVENIITGMLKSKDLFLGNPEITRDFLHIDDVKEFYKKLIEKGKPGEIYNAGWGREFKIKELAEIGRKITNFNGQIHWNSIPSRPGEFYRMALDASKARKELGWVPKIQLQEGLKKIMDYWRDK